MKIYKPEDFTVAGSDERGNSVRATCRITPSLDRACDVIFESHKFPFRVKADLMRWCLREGVKQLDTMDSVSDGISSHTESMMSLIKDEDREREFLTITHRLAALVDRHIKDGEENRARYMVSQMFHHINQMSDGFWKARYLKEMNNRFGSFMDVKGAIVGDSMDSGPDHGIDEDES